jgi:hypothetical protein
VVEGWEEEVGRRTSDGGRGMQPSVSRGPLSAVAKTLMKSRDLQGNTDTNVN